jgi:fermentation-respiration switch protein FrsA (DUF1100 family)
MPNRFGISLLVLVSGCNGAWILVADDHSPAYSIARIAPVPLLVIHGDRDSVVSLEHGRQVFEAAQKPKEFWFIRGGMHGDALTTHGVIYRPRLVEFFRRCLSSSPSDESSDDGGRA